MWKLRSSKRLHASSPDPKSLHPLALILGGIHSLLLSKRVIIDGIDRDRLLTVDLTRLLHLLYQTSVKELTLEGDHTF